MSTISIQRTVREGSAHKRAAILAAARELFVHDGVERTSMDAVAARAGVSKRTVYDYYGDKRRLLLGVVEAAGESLLASLRRAIDEHLSDAADIHDTAGLERALTDFAVQIGVSLLGSSDYAATFELIAENAVLLPELENDPLLDAAPEEAVAERIAHFAALGLLETDDPRLAADHFNALTTLLANNRYPGRADPDRIRQTMVDGVHVFMRAYARR